MSATVPLCHCTCSVSVSVKNLLPGTRILLLNFFERLTLDDFERLKIPYYESSNLFIDIGCSV